MSRNLLRLTPGARSKAHQWVDKALSQWELGKPYLLEIRLWLTPAEYAALEWERIAMGLQTNAETLARLIPKFEPGEHPF